MSKPKHLSMPGTFAVPVLTYHQIEVAPPRGAPMRSLYVSPAAFKRQMQILKWLGYTGLSMTELLPYIRGEKSGRVVGITFDDGYLNNLHHAAPILSHFGFSSTCYVVSDLIGGTNSWDRSIGVQSAQLMNESEIKSWLSAGQEIGSHTLSHSNLLTLNEQDARREIVESKQALERRFGVEVHQFCYPYGDYDQSHASWVTGAGYLAATTTKRGRVQVPKFQQGAESVPLFDSAALFELVRVPVVRSTSVLQFLLKIATPYEDRHAH